MIMNNVAQIMVIKITKGNIDDRMHVAGLTKKLKSSIYADLFKNLCKQGSKLITGIRKNMKNYLINLVDKKSPRKIFCLKTIFGFLNNFYESRAY